MCESIAVMQRYELKYLPDEDQTARLLEALRGRMLLDRYGRTSIASLYYDTPDARLIRASMDGPRFKEKIRLRSYGLADESSPVFLELKRKAEGIVYKRRIETTVFLANAFFEGFDTLEYSQIGKELLRFRAQYPRLQPACLIIYDREAYYDPESDLRLTLDFNPRYRMDHLTLTHSMMGRPLLPPGKAVLEIKVQQAMPLWLTHALDEAGIRKAHFSKFGEAWRLEHAPAGILRPGKEIKPCLIPSIHRPLPQASFS